MATVVLLVLLAQFVHFLVTNKELRWDVIADYFFEPPILRGIRMTIYLTALAMGIGFVLGMLVAIMRLSPSPLIRGIAWVYTWFFRGTPVLVQVLFWYALPAIFDKLSLGVPFGPEWFHAEPRKVITQFMAAALGLGLNEAAYMSEIVRAGLLSVDEGQAEAAHALGLTRTQTLRHVVIPQAMRVIIPPTGNETISMLKTTSIVSVIAVIELLDSVELVYARTFQIIPMLIVASLWYLIMTSILSIGQYYLERYYARGSSRGTTDSTYEGLKAKMAGLRSRGGVR